MLRAIKKKLKEYKDVSKLKKAFKAGFETSSDFVITSSDNGSFFVSFDWRGSETQYAQKAEALCKSNQLSVLNLESGRMIVQHTPFHVTNLPTYKIASEKISKGFDDGEIDYETYQSFRENVIPFAELSKSEFKPVFINRNITKGLKLASPFVCNYFESETDILKSVLDSDQLSDETKSGVEIIIKEKELLEKAVVSKGEEENSSLPTMRYQQYLTPTPEDFELRPRTNMPQISEEDMHRFLIHFATKSNGATVKIKKKKLKDLKPSQSEFNDAKILNILEQKSYEGSKFVISSDGRILDGHHRWAAALENDPEEEVEVYEINLPAAELIRRANLLRYTTKQDVSKAEDFEPLKKGETSGARYFEQTPQRKSFEKAEYQGRTVELDKPFRDKEGNSKFGVYVKNEKGNVIKVGFGDKDMEIKRDDPERRASFRARHKCSEKKDKTEPGYWSCKFWEAGSTVSELLKAEADDKIAQVMREFQDGKLTDSGGNVVTDSDQALAIAYNEAGLSKAEFGSELTKAMATWALVMLFHNDTKDFALGWEAGAIYERLKSGQKIVSQIIRNENVAQVREISNALKVPVYVGEVNDEWSFLSTEGSIVDNLLNLFKV